MNRQSEKVMAAFFVVVFVSLVTAAAWSTPQVRPVPDDSITVVDDSTSQLDAIEAKVDQVLAKLDDLKPCGCPDATCPDCPECPDSCPTEPLADELPPKPEPVTPKIREVNSPKWRINGKVWERGELIDHLLNHVNHVGKYDQFFLHSLTTKQLWALHDSDHDSSLALDVIPVEPDQPGRPSPQPPAWDNPGNCPGGVCPPRRARMLPGLFRWRR